jgi:hypothetical protein
MNWNNLKSYKCPKCGGNLCEKNWSLRGSLHVCTTCDFEIRKEKFNTIVNDKYQPRKCVTFEQNLGELNNLGRKEITEGFLDNV